MALQSRGVGVVVVLAFACTTMLGAAACDGATAALAGGTVEQDAAPERDGGGDDADGGTPRDAAPDAPPDGGADAESDGGLPDPLAEARDEARASFASAELGRAAVDGDLLPDEVELEAELLAVRLDAIIGEKGLVASAGIIGEKGRMMLRALPTSAVPTIVIVRHLAVAIGAIANVLEATSRSTVPEVVAWRRALSDLDAALRRLHALLQDRFREIVETVAVPTERELSPYVDRRRVRTIGGRAQLHAIAEGASAAAPTATLSWTCDTSPLNVRVVDDESDGSSAIAEALDAPASGSMSLTLSPPDTPRSLRVEIETLSPPAAYGSCVVDVAGERHVRGSTIAVFPGEQWVLENERPLFDNDLARIDTAFGSLRGGSGTATAIAMMGIVEQYLRERDGAGARWRTMLAPTSIEPEDFEMLSTEIGVLDRIGLALETSPLLAPGTPADFPDVLTFLQSLRERDATAIGLLAEGDTGPPPS